LLRKDLIGEDRKKSELVHKTFGFEVNAIVLLGGVDMKKSHRHVRNGLNIRRHRDIKKRGVTCQKAFAVCGQEGWGGEK